MAQDHDPTIMTLTKRGEYALRTMIRLGIAAWNQEGLISVSTIALGEHMPSKFLEAILMDLKAGGFVTSVRGKYGGAKLARPMQQIKMGEIVRWIDGKLAPIGCASETEYEKCSCPDEEHCGLRMLMIDVRNAIANILDRYSLGDVVEVTLRKQEQPEPRTTKTRRQGKGAKHADPADGFLAQITQSLRCNHPQDR